MYIFLFLDITVDIGANHRLLPSRYCLRHGYNHKRGSGKGSERGSAEEGALRSWILQARAHKKDQWTVLKTHINDKSLSSDSFSAANWTLPEARTYNPPDLQNKGFRYFLIQGTGPNSGGTYSITLAGIEFYGLLKSIV